MPFSDPAKYLRKEDHPIYGQPSYKDGNSVPHIILKYGSIMGKIHDIPIVLPYMIGCLRELRRSNRELINNPYKNKSIISEKQLADMKKIAKDAGVSAIGFVRLDKRHMFKDTVALFKNAIVFAIEMKHDLIKTAPSKQAVREIFRTYYELSKASNIIAEYLRSQDFNAQAVPAISNNLDLVSLARDAGLGEFGMHGLLITPEYGPSIRLAAVLTDIENLPFSQENTHLWIKDFCLKCGACIRACPAQAIYKSPIRSDYGTETHIDYKKCAVPFSRLHGCTICIKECTFFKTDYKKIREGFLRKNFAK